MSDMQTAIAIIVGVYVLVLGIAAWMDHKGW